MMTATEKLRRLLDERGVEWNTFSVGNTEYTHWTSSDGHWCAASIGGLLSLHVNILDATPAQAVEATLGRGTCRMEPFIYEDTGAFIECSECGWQLFDADYSIDAAREWLGYCPCCGRKVVDT